MEYIDLVEQFVAAHFPKASTAVVGGSTSRGERTATSDIDLLLIGDDMLGEDQIGIATCLEFDGEIFEVFAYTPHGFQEWAERSIAQHRPVIVNMLVDGHPVRRGDGFDAMRSTWAERLAAGPTVDAHEIAFRRYVITDVLDDLRDASDPLEQRVLASTLFERTSELMLLSAGKWVATGKHLPRQLRDLSPERVDALTTPFLQGDIRRLADAVEEELVAAGGRVQAGFIR